VLVVAASASALSIVSDRIMGESSGFLLGNAEVQKAICSQLDRQADGPTGMSALVNADS
jgi:hypothetical protein